MSGKYYMLTVQPDEPITFRFATEDEYNRVRAHVKKMPEVVIDDKNSGTVEFSTAEDAIRFIDAVWK